MSRLHIQLSLRLLRHMNTELALTDDSISAKFSSPEQNIPASNSVSQVEAYSVFVSA
jgi:hypothetical protein